MLYEVITKFWALGEKEIYEYVRFFTISAADFLEDYFENDLIKGAMASPGIIDLSVSRTDRDVFVEYADDAVSGDADTMNISYNFV